MSKMFEININDMVISILESAQDYFSQLRTLETEYFETLLPLLSSYLSNIDEENKTPFIIGLTEEKDTLNNRLTTSHFIHIQVCSFFMIYYIIFRTKGLLIVIMSC
jgi:hypothetical protein